MAAVLPGQVLASKDPLGTRPMARLAAAILLARAGESQRAEAQVDAAAEPSEQAPEPELVEAVRAVVRAWPPRSASGQVALPGDALSEAQWNILDERMGWFAQLVRCELTVADPALQKSFADSQGWLLIGVFAVGGWLLAIGLGGLVLLVVLACLAATGRIRSGLEPMPPMHTLLGETFIAWMLLFLGIRLVAGSALAGDSGAGTLWLSLAINFATLGALAWAVLRGASWKSLREATGLRMPGGPWRLAWLSACSYACALPCMGLGLVLSLLLSAILGDRPLQDVSHPVQDMLPGAGFEARLGLFALAVLAAPVVEEIAFRGLLYGHVRQVTPRWPRWLSIGAAMLFSGTIFAAIHPQGILLVPALAGISIGFCITREWSGSVVPGMVAHGFHNGLLLTMNLLMQG
ncbi:MAG: CPBP family intramembrane metalloprotease [Planctomycetes bacterium]|nr:CPBP family intramembrane metalloprotease [Planctomycetota bacterium]